MHVGADGWLFLVGGSNRPLRAYRRDPRLSLRLWRWRRLIEARAARCRRDGIAFIQLVVPEKLSVYDHRAPRLGIRSALAPTRRRAARLARSPAGYLDLVGPMRDARDEADLFHRTDSHWSFAGCHLAYGAICRALGAVPVPDLAGRSVASTQSLGDLGGKLVPPVGETIERHWFLRDAVRVAENRISAAMWEGRLLPDARFVGIRTSFANARPDADPRRVVLFGDSFAETLPTRLTGMLAETFREVHFVWSTSLDWGFVAGLKPDILICELAERFLTRVPDDRFAVERGGPVGPAT